MKIKKHPIAKMLLVSCMLAGVCYSEQGKTCDPIPTPNVKNKIGSFTCGGGWSVLNSEIDFTLQLSGRPLRAGNVRFSSPPYTGDGAIIVYGNDEHLPDTKIVLYRDGCWIVANVNRLTDLERLQAEFVFAHENDHVVRYQSNDYPFLRVKPRTLTRGLEPSFSLDAAWGELVYAYEGAADFAGKQAVAGGIGALPLNANRTITKVVWNSLKKLSSRLIEKDNPLYEALFRKDVQNVVTGGQPPSYEKALEKYKNNGGDSYLASCHAAYKKEVEKYLQSYAVKKYGWFGVPGTLKLHYSSKGEFEREFTTSDVYISAYIKHLVELDDLVEFLEAVKDAESAERLAEVIRATFDNFKRSFEELDNMPEPSDAEAERFVGFVLATSGGVAERKMRIVDACRRIRMKGYYGSAKLRGVLMTIERM